MRAKKTIYPRVLTGELTEDGKKVRLYLPKVRTKKQELKARKEYYSKKRKICKSTKFNVYCDYWLERAIFKAESTKELYKTVIRKHLKPFFGDMKLGSIKRLEIENFRTKLLKEHHYSTHYINLNINVLRKMFNDANRNEILQFPPTRAISIFEYKKKEVVIPDHNECARIACILKEAKKYKLPLMFGWYAGLRRGEALAVRWEDINLKENVINVNQQIVIEAGNRIVCKQPKRNEIRTVPIAKALRAELVKVPPEERHGLVYKNIRSKSPIAFNNYFKKYIKPLTGIKSFHNFRHINLTKLLNLPNIPIDLVKNIAGHGSVNTTTQIYGHKTSEGINQIREALDNELN